VSKWTEGKRKTSSIPSRKSPFLNQSSNAREKSHGQIMRKRTNLDESFEEKKKKFERYLFSCHNTEKCKTDSADNQKGKTVYQKGKPIKLKSISFIQ